MFESGRVPWLVTESIAISVHCDQRPWAFCVQYVLMSRHLSGRSALARVVARWRSGVVTMRLFTKASITWNSSSSGLVLVREAVLSIVLSPSSKFASNSVSEGSLKCRGGPSACALSAEVTGDSKSFQYSIASSSLPQGIADIIIGGIDNIHRMACGLRRVQEGAPGVEVILRLSLLISVSASRTALLLLPIISIYINYNGCNGAMVGSGCNASVCPFTPA